MTPDAPRLVPPLLKAVLATQELTIAGFAQRLGISEGYLWRVIGGRGRPAAALWGRMRQQLGQAGWDFATGAVDTLTVEARTAS
jgi:hypothetical protein